MVLVIFMLLGTVQIRSHYLKNCMLFTPFLFSRTIPMERLEVI